MKDMIKDMLVEAADEAWRKGGLPSTMDCKKWGEMDDDAAVIAWLQMVRDSMGEAAEVLDAEADRAGGTCAEPAWGADAMHAEAVQAFIGALLTVKTGRLESRPCTTVSEIAHNLPAALLGLRNSYMRRNWRPPDGQ